MATGQELLQGKAVQMAGQDDSNGGDLVGFEAARRRLGGISKRTLFRLTSTGQLPYIKLRRVLRFQRADLDAFVAANRVVRRIETAKTR